MVLNSPSALHTSVLPIDYSKTSGSHSKVMLTMSDSSKAIFYCALLALQFGLQPLLASSFTSPNVIKSSVVISTEIGKIIIGAISLLVEPRSVREDIKEHWSLLDSLRVAALPATLYAIQNLMIQYGYQLLDSMSFNLINQTKTLSAALWLYIMMGQKQSIVQMFALFLLLAAGNVRSK
jgi:UDP-sugar transporter A1/2/3